MIESAQQELEHSLNVLAVSPTHSWDDIEKQYRQLIQRWHPDRNPGAEADVAQTKFIEINSAFKLIRAHYRKNGSIPRPLPPEQKGPLLGTRKQTKTKPALYKNKFAIAAVLGFTIVMLFGIVLWSLDSRLAENNRDRADAEKAEAARNSALHATNPTNDKAIIQSSAAVEP